MLGSSARMIDWLREIVPHVSNARQHERKRQSSSSKTQTSGPPTPKRRRRTSRGSWPAASDDDSDRSSTPKQALKASAPVTVEVNAEVTLEASEPDAPRLIDRLQSRAPPAYVQMGKLVNTTEVAVAEAPACPGIAKTAAKQPGPTSSWSSVSARRVPVFSKHPTASRSEPKAPVVKVEGDGSAKEKQRHVSKNCILKELASLPGISKKSQEDVTLQQIDVEPKRLRPPLSKRSSAAPSAVGVRASILAETDESVGNKLSKATPMRTPKAAEADILKEFVGNKISKAMPMRTPKAAEAHISKESVGNKLSKAMPTRTPKATRPRVTALSSSHKSVRASHANAADSHDIDSSSAGDAPTCRRMASSSKMDVQVPGDAPTLLSMDSKMDVHVSADAPTPLSMDSKMDAHVFADAPTRLSTASEFDVRVSSSAAGDAPTSLSIDSKMDLHVSADAPPQLSIGSKLDAHESSSEADDAPFRLAIASKMDMRVSAQYDSSNHNRANNVGRCHALVPATQACASGFFHALYAGQSYPEAPEVTRARQRAEKARLRVESVLKDSMRSQPSGKDAATSNACEKTKFGGQVRTPYAPASCKSKHGKQLFEFGSPSLRIHVPHMKSK